jgi:ketosteroid isomerase-like protein
MADLETRVRAIEDRIALEDVIVAYYSAIDSLSDLDGLLDCYVEDGIMDLTGLGLPRVQGKAAIGAFFKHVFADMSHHAHFVSNFRVSRLAADEATARAYVIGMGRAHAGTEVIAHACYDIDYVRTGAGWKMRSFTEAALMPLSATVSEVHGRAQKLDA